MKKRKKIAIGCGGLFLITVLAIAGLALLVYAKKNKYDKLAFPFFEEVIPALSSWNPEEFEPYWATEVTEGIEPNKIEQLFGMYRKLGDLEYYEEPQFLQVMASTSNPYGSFVTYSIEADYQNGNAHITCILVPTENDGLKIWKLQINSDAFLDPIDDQNATESI